MSKGFVHSVKVPRLYKVAAKIVREVRENCASLKDLIFEKKHPNVSGIYALTTNTLQNESHLDELLRKIGIFNKEPRMDPWLARVLITELLWGKQCLQSNCKPVQTILAYEKELRAELKNVDHLKGTQCTKRVHKPRYVRVNTILLSVEDAIAYFKSEGWSLLPGYSDYPSFLRCVAGLTGYNFMQDFHVAEMFVFPPDTPFHNCVAYLNGEIVLQDKASCFPTYFLNPPIGAVVLDMCAAPGMKSSHLAATLQNEGKVYAVELDSKRYETLCQQLKITNAYCVRTFNKDTLTVDATQCPDVEYIMVDPTCSGSGMVDRPRIDALDKKHDPIRLKNLHAFQVFVLRHALLQFPSVKRVVYSTCSIHREENEDVVDEILTNVGESYRLLSVKEMLGDKWMHFSAPDAMCGENCLYARPEIDLCNGFFVAVFERNFDVPLPSCVSRVAQITNGQEDDVSENEQPIEAIRKRKKRTKRKKATQQEEEQQTNISNKENEMQLLSEDRVVNVGETNETLQKKSCKKRVEDTIDTMGESNNKLSEVESPVLQSEYPTDKMEIADKTAQKAQKKKKKKRSDEIKNETNDTLQKEQLNEANVNSQEVLREKSRMTQSQVAEELGKNANNISLMRTTVELEEEHSQQVEGHQEVLRKRSKKKETKDSKAVEEQSVNDTDLHYIEENPPKKKKKKKSISSDIDATVLSDTRSVQEVVDVEGVQEIPKRRIKKKKSIITEELKDQNQSVVDNAEEVPRKKKKIEMVFEENMVTNDTSNAENELNDSLVINLSDDGILQKKKKKKKKNKEKY